VDAPVLLVTPLPCLTIQVLHIRKPSARHEILLNELNGPFHLALRLRPPDAADFRNHANRCGEILKQRMPSGLSIISHPKDDRLHLVGQHRLWNPSSTVNP